MPCTTAKCPGREEYHSYESGFCLNECADPCMPLSVIVQIQNKARTDKHQADYISATSLGGCQRSLYGERTIPHSQEYSQQWWSIRGTLLHLILENPDFASQISDMRGFVERLAGDGKVSQDVLAEAWEPLLAQLQQFSAMLPQSGLPDWQAETEYVMPLFERHGKEWFLHGTLDVLRPGRGVLYDYKTLGDKGLNYLKNGLKEDHIMQTNIYRLLAEHGYPKGMDPKDYTPVKVNSITIFYLTMMEVVRSGGIIETTVGPQKSEPEVHPAEISRELLDTREDLVLKRGKRKASATPDDYELSVKSRYKLAYKLPDVPILPTEDVLTYIRERATILVDAFHGGVVPPMCSPKMREWKCNYCPREVVKWCDEVNAVDGVDRLAVVSDDLSVEVEVA